MIASVKTPIGLSPKLATPGRGPWRRVAAAVVLLTVGLTGACTDAGEPRITSVEPSFAPADSLVVVEGENLGSITSMRFDGQLVNFNTAYNSDNALLFRVPRSLPAADYTAVLETDGGSASFPFRVSKPAPRIDFVRQAAGGLGDVITIVGSNFFEPVTVFFTGDTDSVPGEIIRLTEDSLRVRIPGDARRGYIYVAANGGVTRSPRRFSVVNAALVTDFDGSGLRPDNGSYFFRAGVEQTADNAFGYTNPPQISGKYLKISGKAGPGETYIGEVRTTPTNREPFGITSAPGSTLLEFDVNNNGKKATRLIIALREQGGSINDFTRELLIDGDGWYHIQQPLTRFTDLNGNLIDPSKIASMKFILNDTDKTGKPFEVNIDNVVLNQEL